MLPTLLEDSRRLAAMTLMEDGGRDLTTDVKVPPSLPARGIIEYRSSGVLAGTAYAALFLGLAALSSVTLFVAAYWLFKRMEAGIADVA